MSKHSSEELLDLFETLLKAQLDAVHQLKQNSNPKAKNNLLNRENLIKRSKSQVDIVYDILQRAGKPLHINEIIQLAREWFNVSFERESLVSALTKKVIRGERFIRTKPNTFGISSKEESQS